MEVLAYFGDVLKSLCKQHKKYGIYVQINWCPETNMELSELQNVIPWFRIEDDNHSHILSYGHGYLLFDSKQEMLEIYDTTVGPSGPTKLNPYFTTQVCVYALSCSPSGNFLNENT